MTQLIRKRIDSNARIKRLRWIFFGLLVIGTFSAVVFSDYQSLLKDSSKVQDSYFMYELSQLKSNNVIWTNSNPKNQDDALELKTVEWENFAHEKQPKLLSKVAEFLYSTQWQRIELAWLHTNKQLLVAEFSLKGSESTEPMIDSRRNFVKKMAMHGSTMEKSIQKDIEKKQRFLSIRIIKVGAQKIDRSYAFANGRYEMFDDRKLAWKPGNYFYFNDRKDLAGLTWASSDQESLSNNITFNTERYGIRNNDLAERYLKLMSMREQQKVTLPVIGINVNVPLALVGALLIASVYITLFNSTIHMLKLGHIQTSDEPWLLVDSLEFDSGYFLNIYGHLIFLIATITHIGILLVPTLVGALAIYILWPNVDKLGAAGLAALLLWAISGGLASTRNFCRLIYSVYWLKSRRFN